MLRHPFRGQFGVFQYQPGFRGLFFQGLKEGGPLDGSISQILVLVSGTIVVVEVAAFQPVPQSPDSGGQIPAGRRSLV